MARMSFEPNIRYCTAGDGVKIAFCDGGVGTPLVAAAFLNNLEVEARWEWHQILASRRRIVLYDSRGAGSSQRDIAGFSVDEMALDIGAVADELGLESFVLFAWLWAVPTAVVYAVRHPERVSHLVLFAGGARGEDWLKIPRVRTLFSMLDQGDLELFTDSLYLNAFGWHLPEVGQRVAAAARGARTLEQTQAFYGAARLYEVQWRE